MKQRAEELCSDEEIKERNSKVIAGRGSSLHRTAGEEISLLSPLAELLHCQCSGTGN